MNGYSERYRTDPEYRALIQRRTAEAPELKPEQRDRILLILRGAPRAEDRKAS